MTDSGFISDYFSDRDRDYAYAYRQGRTVHDRDAFARRHPRMTLLHRAKLFAPFDALDTFDETIEEKRIVNVPPKELTEEEKERMDRKLRFLSTVIGKKHAGDAPPLVTAVYFKPDWKSDHTKGDGTRGNYLRLTGALSLVDPQSCILQIVETRIPFDDLYILDCPLLIDDDISAPDNCSSDPDQSSPR